MMGNLRNPPLFLRPSVARRLITGIATIAQGIAEVPILPIKLVDQPNPSAMRAKRKTTRAEKTRLDSSHAPAVNDIEFSALPVDSCATGIEGESGRVAPPESAPVRADGEPCPVSPDWPDAPLPDDIDPDLDRAEPVKAKRKRKSRATGAKAHAQAAREARNCELLDAYAAGGTVEALAARFGVAVCYVYELARTHGLKRKTGKPVNPKVAARNAEMLTLFAAGEPVPALMARFGLSRANVYKIAELAGHKRPRADTSARDAELLAAFAAGEPVADLAVRFGINGVWIYQIAKKAGVARPAKVKPVEKVKEPRQKSQFGAPAGEKIRSGQDAPRESVSQNPLVKPEAVAKAAGEKRSPILSSPDSSTSGAGFYSEAAVKARAQEAGRKRAHAENAAKAERKLSRRAAQADFEDRAVSEFEAALAKARARKAGAVEVISPKPAALQDEGKRLAAAFAARAAQKSTSVPAATGPTKHASGREECPRCGIPGWKGCAHFLPCEDQPVRAALPQDDPEYDGRVTSAKHRTGGRQAVRL